jgi:flagellum-specific peptidoglycan hydrolase FlgJ
MIKENKAKIIPIVPIKKTRKKKETRSQVLRRKLRETNPHSVWTLFIGLVLFCSSFFSNKKDSIVTSQNNETQEIKDIPQVVEASIVSTNMFKSQKTIPITDIIKDPKVLNFLTHNNVLQRAYKVSQETGLSMAAILGQKGCESAWGESSLCELTKNLGNIKCTVKAHRKFNLKGIKHKCKGSRIDHCIQLYDDSPNDRFVAYKTYQEGWDAYCSLIEKRYSKAAKKNTVESELATIKKLGYATDPKYAEKIITLINQKHLKQLELYIRQGYTITTQTGKYKLL